MRFSIWSMHRAEGCRILTPAPIAELDRDMPRIGERLRHDGIRYWVRDIEHMEDGEPARVSVEMIGPVTP